MPIQFPCGTCSKPVGNKHKAIQCDICNLWIHIKCNNIPTSTYEKLITDDQLTWCCTKCTKSTIPFSDCTREVFKLTLQGKNPSYFLNNNDELADRLKLLDSLPLNEETSQISAYYTLDELNNLKPIDSSVATLHTNIASLGYYFDELYSLLSNSNVKFDFIGITETRIKHGVDPIQNTELKGYSQMVKKSSTSIFRIKKPQLCTGLLHANMKIL